MVYPLGSFLLRLWRAEGSLRIEIEHIQTGAKELVVSIAEAVEWIEAYVEDDPSDVAEQVGQTPDSATERSGSTSPARHPAE